MQSDDGDSGKNQLAPAPQKKRLRLMETLQSQDANRDFMRLFTEKQRLYRPN